MKRRSGGLADSPFFPKPEGVKPATKPTTEVVFSTELSQPPTPDPIIPEQHVTALLPQQTIERLRKAVREFGKEAATYRLTMAEKRALASIIYTFGNRGLKTNENELARIAINYLLDDHTQNGENSILERTIRALRA